MRNKLIEKLTTQFPRLKDQRFVLKTGATSIIITFLVLFYIFILHGLPNPKGLQNYKIIPVSTQILDRKGRLLYEIFREQNRTPVKIKELPDYVKNSTIAIEDKDFYRHGGISIIGGMIRAFKDTLLLNKGVQGGSTITQQLVKSALLTPERTIQRKVREVVLAIWAEQILSKDEILELYLNQVPYGGVSYGIEEAARTYFGKHAAQLTLSQASFLAGMPQAPSLYSPYTNPDGVKRRQAEVLKSMTEQDFITEKERQNAYKEKLSILPPKKTIRAPHFVFYVKNILDKQYGVTTVEEGGLRVYTTLDLDIQKIAETAVNEEVAKIKYLRASNGASLVTRPSTGEILAMVGSTDFFATASGTFNVTTAHRQPGSSIKPINYAIGIDRKLVNPATLFLDTQTCFPSPEKQYCPVNYDGKYHGLVPLRNALGNSFNIPAVKMLGVNGVENFIASASGFMINSFTDPSRYGLSLTLGGGEVRMTEMAQAFSSFANEGTPKQLVPILKIINKNNQVLYKYKDSNIVADVTKPLPYPNYLVISGKRTISKETAFLISHILSDNGARSQAFGSSSLLVIPKKTVSVKTGTTNDIRDNWTIGYTPNFLVVVWVGNNDNTPLSPGLTSGVTGAAPIWNRIMRGILAKQPDLAPRRPDGVVGRQICTTQVNPTEIENPDCHPKFEYFIKGTENLKPLFSIEKAQVPVSKDTDMQTTKEDPQGEMREKTVAKDQYSQYCIDCAHPVDPTPTPR